MIPLLSESLCSIKLQASWSYIHVQAPTSASRPTLDLAVLLLSSSTFQLLEAEVVQNNLQCISMQIHAEPVSLPPLTLAVSLSVLQPDDVHKLECLCSKCLHGGSTIWSSYVQNHNILVLVAALCTVSF